MEKIGIIIQARLNSVRLPGKVLKNLVGKPMIQYLIDRLESSTLALPWVIATSDQASDDPLAEFCLSQGYDFERGSLDRVTDRFLITAKKRGWQHCVRICADSPLLDPEIIQGVLNLYKRTQPDLATNVWPRSFPKGQSVEIFKIAALEKAQKMMKTDQEQEHVTQHFYHFPEHYAIENFLNTQDLSLYSLAVDTFEDWQKIEAMINAFSKNHLALSMNELISRLGKQA
jgi:spore coat polysaccharide biosynthesis protein SpsF